MDSVGASAAKGCHFYFARQVTFLSCADNVRSQLSAAEEWYKKSLDIRVSLDDRRAMASSYHNLGMVAHDRGDSKSAMDWYQASIDLNKALGNRPGLALTYAQLGLLTEQADPISALDWAIRCVALFDSFPHPSTGSGPEQLARVTQMLGVPALEEAWQRVTGQSLPVNMRTGVERMIRSARSNRA
jgi:hypothetical protein